MAAAGKAADEVVGDIHDAEKEMGWPLHLQQLCYKLHCDDDVVPNKAAITEEVMEIIKKQRE